MLPQLAGVLTGRDRGDDRAKEATLTIHRDRRHAKGPHALDPVLVLGKDARFHTWIGCLGAPGRIETRLAQGAFDHRRVSERFLALVTRVGESDIETTNRLIAEALTRPRQQRKGGVAGDVGVTRVVIRFVDLSQAQELPDYLDRAHLLDLPNP